MSLGRRTLLALWVGSGIYLSLGGLSVIRTGTVDRVGVLAPIWVLLLVVALCGIAALLIRSHNWSLLWLPALLLPLPWLPLPVPAAFLLWLGPLASVVWAALAAAAATSISPPLIDAPSNANSGPQRPALSQTPGFREAVALFTHPRRAPAVAAALAAGIYLLAGWQLSAFLPAGDEPHYLVIADSLRGDADIKIENNHRARQYLEYFSGELKPDYLRRGANGQIYSIHAPGLPALFLPAYAFFGYAGAVTLLALLSAAASALAWRLCFELTGGRPGAAWFGWAVAALPAPVLFHASSIYPDGAGAILVLTGAAALMHAERLTVRRALLHGAALALLPWLHTRFVLLAAALAVCVLARLATATAARARPTRAVTIPVAAAFLAVPAASAAAWFMFFYVVYGTPDPRAPYGTYTQSELAHIGSGLTGLLFDQQFGLMTNAPIYLTAVCGLGWTIFCKPRAWAADAAGTATRRFAIEVTCVVVPYMLAVAMYRMWWGGWSAPARFLTPILPLLALIAAITFAEARSITAKASILLSLAVSLWLSAIMLIVRQGRLAYNDRDGFALWADWANPSIDLASGLPSLFATTWRAALVRAAVIMLIGGVTFASLAALERLWRKRRASAAFPIAIIPIAYALAAMAAVTVNWRLAGVSGLRPEEGQVALLRFIDADRRQIGVEYGGAMPHPIAVSAVKERLRITSATRRLPRNRPLFFMPGIPAGRYHLLTQDDGVHDGRLDVFIGRSATPIRSFDLASAQSALPEITLPIEAASLTVQADERARRHVRQVTLAPDASSSLGSPGPRAAVAIAPAVQTARYGASTVYATSDLVYLEPPGFWVQPRAAADLLIDRELAPGQPFGPITLLLRNGPLENRVRLDVESWHHEVTLPAGGETVVDVPASRRGPTPLRVYAAEGFRPSALDPANGDHRRLGVWIELR